jgi:hypothetical protein
MAYLVQEGRPMADDLAMTLFAESRAQTETAGRWFAIAAVLFAFFHIMIIHPYLLLKRDFTQADTRLKQEVELQSDVASLQPLVERVKNSGTESTRLRDALQADLVRTFRDLNQILAALQSMGPDAAAGPGGNALFSRATPVQAQGPAQQGLVVREIPVMDTEMRRDVARLLAQGTMQRSAFLDRIRAYVETAIVKPKLDAFNDDWKGKVVPLRQDTDALIKRLAELKPKYAARPLAADPQSEDGRYLAYLSALEASAPRVLKSAEDMNLQLVPGAHWWETESAKEGFLIAAGAALNNAVDQKTATFAELTTYSSDMLNTARQDESTVEMNLKAMRAAFENQESKLAEAAGPLKVISIDLETFAAHFPLILSVAFILFTGWIAYRFQQLKQAVALVERHEHDGVTREWFLGYAVSSPWYNETAIAVRAGVLMLWVTLAGRELAGSMPEVAGEAAWAASLGALGIAIVSLYEWRLVNGARVAPSAA